MCAGVPCVTLAGGCHAHNVGVSLISTVGLAEHWVAASEDEYVALALRAASDLEARPPPRRPPDPEEMHMHRVHEAVGLQQCSAQTLVPQTDPRDRRRNGGAPSNGAYLACPVEWRFSGFVV